MSNIYKDRVLAHNLVGSQTMSDVWVNVKDPELEAHCANVTSLNLSTLWVVSLSHAVVLKPTPPNVLN